MKAKLLLIMVIMPVVMLIAGTGIASAASPEITSVNVFSDYLQTDDWLIVVTTNVSEAPYYPYYTSTDYWTLQLLDSTNTSIANVALAAWNMSPGSIYLSAAQASSLSWSGTYSVRVIANYNSSINGSLAIGASDWKGNSPTSLDGWVRGQAAVIGTYLHSSATYYLVTDAELGQILSLEGGAMFTHGIPYIEIYRPTLFAITISGLGNFSTITHDTAYSDSLDDWETAVGPQFHALIDDVATLVHLDGQMVGAMGFVVVAFALMIGGVVYGASSAGIMGGSILICVAALFGFVPLVVLAIPAIILAFLFIKAFWLTGGA